MNLIDLTYPLNENTTPYPRNTCFSKIIVTNYENGCQVVDTTFSTGIGTHMDAPSHFIKGGLTVDKIPLVQCYAKACVIHLEKKVKGNIDYEISAEDLLIWEKNYGKIQSENIVLAHTGWDRYWGKDEFCLEDETGIHYPGFSLEAAELLSKRSPKGVGIDTMGIDPGYIAKFVAHIELLKNKIFLVENLANLKKLPPIGAEVWIMPMKLEDAPEAPVRAFAKLASFF